MAAAYIFVAAVSTTLSDQVTTTSPAAFAFAFAFSKVQSRLIEILWQRSRGEREPGECRGTTDQVAQLCLTQTDKQLKLWLLLLLLPLPESLSLSVFISLSDCRLQLLEHDLLSPVCSRFTTRVLNATERVSA